MNRRFIPIITAAVLILLGTLIFTVTMAVNEWDFTKLNTTEYETNTYEITEDFENILINTDTVDIEILPCESGKCKVICEEDKKATHSVKVTDNVLTIEKSNSSKWYENINIINYGYPKISVYLPDVQFEDIIVRESTGDITAEKINAANIEISVSTGNINAKDITCSENIKIKVSTGKLNLKNTDCKNLFTEGNTGDITLNNVIANEKFSIVRTTGDVIFKACDAKEVYTETNTGDITGSLLTEKTFSTKTNTGDIEIPQTLNGGKCELTTTTGDINITLVKKGA